MGNRKWNVRVNRLRVLALVAAGAAFFPLHSHGALTHRWTFNDGTATDSVGTAHGTLYGSPVISGGKLILNSAQDRSQYMTTVAFSNETVGVRTLVAWVSLSSLSQAGGAGVLGIHPAGVDNFDSIVYGERTARQWMNGSTSWARSVANNGGAAETSTDEVMLAIAYDSDNSIKLYRNGVRYDTGASKGTLVTRTEPIAVLGRRQAAAGPSLQGAINEARVYNTALSEAEIAALYAEGPTPNPAVDLTNLDLRHRWSFNDGTTVDSVGPANGTLYGTATVTNGRLRLSGSSGDNRMETAALGRALTNKTLVAWCTLDNPAVRYSGSVLSAKDGGKVDGIVYAERTTNQWMNGSDNWRRTPGNNDGAAETSADPAQIMMAITYDQSLPTKAIKLYRNGTLYAEVTPTWPVTNFAATSSAVIGPRSVTWEGYINGSVAEARIYGKALSAFEVAALAAQGPDPATGVWGQPVSGGWDRGANWLGGLVPDSIVSTVDFSTLDISTDTSVSLNGPRTVAKATFADASASHDWYLSPGTNGTLTLAAQSGAPEIAVSNRTATVALPLAGTNGFVKSGAGTLTLAATNGYQGATVVSAGTLRLGTTLAHRWSFDDGTANDSIGAANGALYGTATISGGKLRLSGSSGLNRMESAAFGHTLGPDKTLVSWCTLDNAAFRYSGSVLTVMSADTTAFDGIVYAESATNQWRNGSDYAKRTGGSGADETLSDPNEIMMAITYESGAANQIKLYRNGALYMQCNPGSALTNFLTTAKTVIGPRHHTGAGYINGTINEARVYRSALTAEQIAAMAAAGPVYAAPSNLLPTGTVVSVASGAALDLSTYSQTVAGLSGSGLVTNSAALTVSGMLTPGDSSSAVSVLTVSSNLTLAAGATFACDHNTTSADTVRVTGTLAVQGANTVQLSAIGAAPPPSRFTLFTFGALTGAENLGGWIVQGVGLAGKNVKVRSEATSIYVTISPRGTLIRVL